MIVARLPTSLVARYRAVDRELIGAPAHVVDTPAHLDWLAVEISQHGIRVPLDLSFNEQFATLDGNHRIAVAIRWLSPKSRSPYVRYRSNRGPTGPRP